MTSCQAHGTLEQHVFHTNIYCVFTGLAQLKATVVPKCIYYTLELSFEHSEYITCLGDGHSVRLLGYPYRGWWYFTGTSLKGDRRDGRGRERCLSLFSISSRVSFMLLRLNAAPQCYCASRHHEEAFSPQVTQGFD